MAAHEGAGARVSTNLSWGRIEPTTRSAYLMAFLLESSTSQGENQDQGSSQSKPQNPDLAGANRWKGSSPAFPAMSSSANWVVAGWALSFKAQNLKYDRPVALKMILSGRGAAFLELSQIPHRGRGYRLLWHTSISC